MNAAVDPHRRPLGVGARFEIRDRKHPHLAIAVRMSEGREMRVFGERFGQRLQ